MNADYDKLNARLYAGDIEECFQFLDERRASDGNTADYWLWRANTHARAGQFLQALDICFMLMREAPAFGFHLHCLSDVCMHLGLRDVLLTAIDSYGRHPDSQAGSALLWRLYGWHYIGEDSRLLEYNADGLDENAAYPLGHYQARSAMRRDGIAQGVQAMHRFWSSADARRVLMPHVDCTDYWCGQRELPPRIRLRSIASGFGDMVQWLRYVSALEAMGVEVEVEVKTTFCRLATPDLDYATLAARMHAAGFARASGDRTMWTDPFALFTALFPAVDYLSAPRYIAPFDPHAADSLTDMIRQRARGRRCVGVFWSSCESPDLYARKSLCLQHLDALFGSDSDIHWVIMQRGFERKRWLDDPRSADTDRFSTVDADISFAQSIALLDQLDAFVGNDGSLTHIAGALGKPTYLMLNQVADWRYENAPNSTPWYPTMHLVRAPTLGAWTELAAMTRALLAG
jgi:hypothetical protein